VRRGPTSGTCERAIQDENLPTLAGTQKGLMDGNNNKTLNTCREVGTRNTTGETLWIAPMVDARFYNLMAV
jgi:hypothetical protein